MKPTYKRGHFGKAVKADILLRDLEKRIEIARRRFLEDLQSYRKEVAS